MKKTVLFLLLLLVCLIVGAVGFFATDTLTTKNSQSVSTNQPNIIFVLTDDQTLADLDYMPTVQKSLVSEGKTFTNYFDNYAVCCVARASILRGQNANNTGIKGNSPPAGGFEVFHAKGTDGEEETIGVWLEKAGYVTAFMGKYLNGYGQDDPAYIPPGWNEWFGFSKNTQSLYDYEVNHNGVIKRFGSEPTDFKTDVLTRAVLSFLQQPSRTRKPFFIYLSPTAPHGPATPAVRHEGMFKDSPMPRTPAFNEADVSDKPEFIRELPVLSVKEIIAIDEKYQKRLESLQAVDDLVKELITTLKSIGALENTYIFFTSDNGFHLGQHRMLPGKRTAYEEDIHLPLIVRGPGVVPGTINELVGNIDFVSTFSDLAGGLSIPYEPDGRSFAGLLSPLFAKPTTWRQGYLIGFELQDLIATGSFEAANWVGRRDDPHTKKIQKNTADQSIDNEENLAGEDILKLGYAGVRTDRYIYIEYGNSDKEFYDLENDPYELQNIYTSADPKLIREHQQMLNALRTCSGLSCKTAEEMPNSFSND